MRWANSGVVLMVVSLVLSGVALAADDASSLRLGSLAERETLTDEFFGASESLEEYGIASYLGLTNVYQRNTRGGLDSGYGHYSMSYDLEIEFDLDPLLGVAGGLLFFGAEGSYDDGIDPGAVGSLLGINGDAGGDRSMDITQLWYQQSWREGNVIFRIGKIDLTGGFDCCGSDVAFDCNAVACSTSDDFLNDGFGGTASVPFPDNGLGAALYVSPVERMYLAAGVGDAEADTRETGFSTAFDGDNDFFWVAEVGFVSALRSAIGALPGAYRFGIWYDHQRKTYLDESRSIDGDVGYYFSGDQMVWRENSDPEDEQGISVFGRVGWADEDVNEIKFYWGCGGQYVGLLPGRDGDILGVGYAQGRVSRDAGYRSSYEGVVDVYYNIEVAPWLHVSPDVQWIMNPGADKTVNNAVVIGLRAQMDL